MKQNNQRTYLVVYASNYTDLQITQRGVCLCAKSIKHVAGWMSSPANEPFITGNVQDINKEAKLDVAVYETVIGILSIENTHYVHIT